MKNGFWIAALGFASMLLILAIPVFQYFYPDQYWITLTLCLLSMGALSALLTGFYRQKKITGKRISSLSESKGNILEYLEASWKTSQKLITDEKLMGVNHLLVGFAHEINTPLGNTLTTLTFLKEYLQGVLPEDDNAKESMDISLDGLRKASGLIEQFLQMASFRNYDETMEIELRELIEDLVDLKISYWPEKTVDLTLECPAELYVMSSRMTLANLLGPILENAIEASQQKLCSIRIQCIQDKNNLTLKIADQGIGIDPSHLPHIFDPFFTTQRGNKKLGLGLASAYNILSSRLGGEIQVSSTKGEGTCMEITIPGIICESKVPSPHKS